MPLPTGHKSLSDEVADNKHPQMKACSLAIKYFPHRFKVLIVQIFLLIKSNVQLYINADAYTFLAFLIKQ